MLFERLVKLNRRYDSARCRVALSAVVFALAFSTYIVHTHHRHSLTAVPSVTGDSAEYDSIAWELSHGRGFEIDLSDPDFRRPYLNDPESAGTAADWPQERYGVTAKRPPLYVAVLSAGNLGFGRQFWFARVVNILCLSATCVLVTWTVARVAGPVPALIAAFQFVVVDWRTRFYGRELLTEAASALFVAVLAVLLIQMETRPRLRMAAAAGAVCGLAVMTRSIFVLWLPGLGLLLLRGGHVRHAAALHRSSLLRAGAFMVAAGVVVSGWWWRNCQILEGIAPLGTQGRMELAAGYSDMAFQSGGMWSNLREAGVYDSVLDPAQSGLEQEEAIANESTRLAGSWVTDNLHKLPMLAAGKVFHELRPHGSGDLYVLSFAVLGLLALRGSPECRVMCGLILACLIGVSLTWSTSGRLLCRCFFHCMSLPASVPGRL